MRTDITLRLRDSRATFQVFFPYSNETVRTELTALGVHYARVPDAT